MIDLETFAIEHIKNIYGKNGNSVCRELIAEKFLEHLTAEKHQISLHKDPLKPDDYYQNYCKVRSLMPHETIKKLIDHLSIFFMKLNRKGLLSTPKNSFVHERPSYTYYIILKCPE